MKNAFYFMLRIRFVLEIFTFLSRLFAYAQNWLDKKPMVNFKFHIAQYLKKQRQPDNEISSGQ